MVDAGGAFGGATEPLALPGPEAFAVVTRLAGGDHRHLGLEVDDADTELVTTVDPGTQSAALGLHGRQGDRLVGIGSQPAPDTLADLCNRLLDEDGRLVAVDLTVQAGGNDVVLDGRISPDPADVVEMVPRPGPRPATDPEGYVSSLVPGRFKNISDITPDEFNDARGFVASEDPDAFTDLGRGTIPGVLLLTSRTIGRGKTVLELADTAIDGVCETPLPWDAAPGQLLVERTWEDCGPDRLTRIVTWRREESGGQLTMQTTVGASVDVLGEDLLTWNDRVVGDLPLLADD